MSMIIFGEAKAVVTRVGDGKELTFSFYDSRERIPFSSAKRVADKAHLEDALARIQADLEGETLQEATTFLTTYPGTVQGAVEKQPSRLRGYQGGLAHFVEMDGDRYLVAVRRGEDAPSSPLMLDISAGRTRNTNIGWRDSLYTWGFEVGFTHNGKLYVPKNVPLEEELADKVLVGAMQKAAYCAGIFSLELTHRAQEVEVAYRQPRGARFLVFDNGATEPREDFYAAWAGLPYVSSIEAMHVAEWQLPDGTVPFDAQVHLEEPIDREVYLIDVETGRTKVYQSGRLSNVNDLTILLSVNEVGQERLQREGSLTSGIVMPVSPKLAAVVEQYKPLGKDHSGLAPLLQYQAK